MEILPAIDLKGGKVVRLQRGKADAMTVYNDDAGVPALHFKAAGAQWIHVVDLDGAFDGKQANTAAVERVLAAGLKVELGGGLRDLQTMGRWLERGVSRLVIGTMATQPGFVGAAVKAFGADAIAVGIDAANGRVAVKGWVETTAIDAVEFAHSMLAEGAHTVIFTDIARDGMLSGPNLPALEGMLAVPGLQVIASGGVSNIEDIRALDALAKRHPNLIGVITGKALYDGRIDLPAAIAAVRRA